MATSETNDSANESDDDDDDNDDDDDGTQEHVSSDIYVPSRVALRSLYIKKASAAKISEVPGRSQEPV